MNAECEVATGEISRRARERMARPLFRGEWLDVVFLHYEMEPEALQRWVPYPLDIWDGRAYVSLVSFTLAGLCWDPFRRVTRLLLRPISDHAFLNVRTYVRVGDEVGIFFLAEWLSNRLSVPLGRPAFGLPYRFGQFERQNDFEGGISGLIAARGGEVRFCGELGSAPVFGPCCEGSLDEFLLERYIAFTDWANLRRCFRVWHQPWPVAPLAVNIEEASLLEETGGWIHEARLVSTHYSPGVRDVWMGAPQFVKGG
jgi:uncharacterized protein YqjF (DUF2071 family)